MRDKLRAAVVGPASSRLAFVCLGAVGVFLAAPFALCRFLPMVDLPMHQLELAIWLGRSVDGHQFAPYYEGASLLLPYWVPVWLAAVFEPLVGVEAAGRMVVALYLAVLPAVMGALCSSARRSPWLAMLVVPFAFEFNLLWGFVAYCLGLAMWVGVLALTLRLEGAPGRRGLGGLAVLSLALGFTHAQLILPAFASVCGLVVLGRGPGRARIALAAAPVLAPLALWAIQPAGATYAAATKSVELASFGELFARMGEFSIDVYGWQTESTFFAAAIGVLGVVWVAAPRRGTWRDHRGALIAAGALASYFLLPWDWHGQAVGQRMLLPALVLLPILSPPDLHPSRLFQGCLVAFALVGVSQTALAVVGFNREATRDLVPLIEHTPPEPRLAQVAYDVRTPWVNAPVYLHAGAWVVLVRGGVYAESFDALTAHHTSTVPQDQRFTLKELGPSRSLDAGRLLVPSERRYPFWNAWMVRWTRQGTLAPSPRFIDPAAWTATRTGAYTLFHKNTQDPSRSPAAP